MRKLFVVLLLITTPQFVATQVGAVSAGPCHVQVFEGKASLAGTCPDGAKIAVYKYKPGVPFDNGKNFLDTLPQTLFSEGSREADLPKCGPFQADAFTGDTLPQVTADHQYKERLIDAVHGDQGTCVDATTTTTSSTTSTTATTLPSTTTPDTVKDTVITRPALANTGSHNGPLSLSGFGLSLMGIGLVVAADQRKKARSWKELWSSVD